MLHFAAHAEADPESPLESAVILTKEGDNYKLYARDITDLKLSADLVTLSACRSAGARAYGGGRPQSASRGRFFSPERTWSSPGFGM